MKLKRVIRFALKCKNRKQYACWRNKKDNNFTNENLHLLDVSQIQQNERCIIKLVQSKCFGEKIKKLLMKKQESKVAKVRFKRPDLPFRPLLRQRWYNYRW